MWIVELHFDLTRRPTESGLTKRTPHLIATVDFENARLALRAVFGVSFKQFDCRNAILVANMLNFIYFNLMAIDTGRFLA
jgi:hypothetical protein